jgi:hypothetical protein
MEGSRGKHRGWTSIRVWCLSIGGELAAIEDGRNEGWWVECDLVLE